MTTKPNGGIEYRFTERSAPKLENGTLSGRAAPFDKETMIGKKPWGFREKIAKGAFAKSINDGDVVLLDQHDTAKPIARQSAGTLNLAETKGGLDWDAEPANTTYANDARENARAGNYGGCSFGFEVVRDSWHYNKDEDVDERTLHEVKLHEISLVTFPAYGDGSTSVSARDMVDAAMEARDQFYAREYLDLFVVDGVEFDENGNERAADGKKPYGNVSYADPGYQKDGKKRYPVDSASHVKSAWSYINKASNAAAYSAKQLASIKSKIKSAAKKFGIKIGSDQKNQAFLPVEPREKEESTMTNADVRAELIDILSNSDVDASTRCLHAVSALARDNSSFDKAVRKAVKQALKDARNKVGTSADSDHDEDDPTCEACGGSGKFEDGVADCPGCAGTGHVAGPGDDEADGDGDHKDSGFGLGIEDGGPEGSNVPQTGHSGDGDHANIGSAGPQVADGSHPTGTGNNGPAPTHKQNNSKETSGETRDGQPDTSTDQDEDENDATRYLKAKALKRRMQFESESK